MSILPSPKYKWALNSAYLRGMRAEYGAQLRYMGPLGGEGVVVEGREVVWRDCVNTGSLYGHVEKGLGIFRFRCVSLGQIAAEEYRCDSISVTI